MITASVLRFLPPTCSIVSLTHEPARLCKCRRCGLLHPCTVSRRTVLTLHVAWIGVLCACSTRRTLKTLSCVCACVRVNISTSSSLHAAQHLKITSQMFEVQYCTSACCPSHTFFSRWIFMISYSLCFTLFVSFLCQLFCLSTTVSATGLFALSLFFWNSLLSSCAVLLL